MVNKEVVTTTQTGSTKQTAMQLKFSHQAYQAQAVKAVVDVFDGQPMASASFVLTSESAGVVHAAEGTIGNRLVISDEQLLENVRKVQEANTLTPSETLVPMIAPKAADDAEMAAGEADQGYQAQSSGHDASDGRRVAQGAKGRRGRAKLSARAESVEEVPACTLNLSIEMKTGTGKTYTFIKTMYELHKQYGFKKFVVVVPSVAIREGTMKNIAITQAHFAADYGRVPFAPVLYDSSRLNELQNFACSDALSVLVINIDSFTKDSNRIRQKGERGMTPIEYIQATHPIVILDEPQNMETPVRREAIAKLNPLCTLRYSATHKNAYNQLYKLDPVKAYDLGLVKQIEVDGVVGDEDHNQAFIELLAIEAKPRGITAKVAIDALDKTSSKPDRKEVRLKLGDDVWAKSGKRDIYANNYTLNTIGEDYIEFSGGRIVRLNEQQDALADDVMRFQIERTVASHFEKLRRLQPQGIKVLSLFFIDRVANYRGYDEDGSPVPGKFARWFEGAFTKYAARKEYQGLIPHEASVVHGGYFSGDKKGKGSEARVEWVDTKGTVAKDEDTYALIMKDKERLLSLSEPLQFIFSHTALREGWDNPNVFQICTLNETRSEMKKRQEIGRGLRLCVNQQGERVVDADKKINVLTVIPNESYESFARSLQGEIEKETGVKFDNRVKDARAKARIRRRQLSAADEALFREIWQKISYRTRYSVKLDTPTLITTCVKALSDRKQYPPVQPPRIRSVKARLKMQADGVHGQANAMASTVAQHQGGMVPDVYAYIQNRVHLTRSTIFAILDQSNRLDELLINPQAFLDMAVGVMKRCLQALMVEGIEYHEINGKRYEMTLFDDTQETYLSSVYPPVDQAQAVRLKKTLLEAEPISQVSATGAMSGGAGRSEAGDGTAGTGGAFACVLSDSEVESQFARDCALDERVRFFFKLPARFRINTPLGTYNPDWAVVFGRDDDIPRVYFVAETKSSMVADDRRKAENLKIECGRRHFALADDDVRFRTVTNLQELIGDRNA